MPSFEELRVPAFCPICGWVMRSSRSTRTYYDFGCCMNCHCEFVEDREERWASGWRPTPEQVAAFLRKISG